MSVNNFSETLDLEMLSKESHRVSSDDGFLDQFVQLPKTGPYHIRILPPPKGGMLFQYNRVHSINGRRLHCPRPLRNGKYDHSVACPNCSYVRALWKKADRLDEQGKGSEAQELKNEARALAAVERYYYNVICRSHANNDGTVDRNVGPKILSVGKSVHKKIVTGIVGDEDERGYGNVTDLQNGRDFTIRIDRKGEFPDYGDSRFSRDPSPAGTKDEVARWRTTLHDLTKLRNPKSVEELEREIAIYRGFIPDDAEFDLEAIRNKFQSRQETDTGDSKPVPDDQQTAVVDAKVADAEIAAALEPVDDSELVDDEYLEELRKM